MFIYKQLKEDNKTTQGCPRIIERLLLFNIVRFVGLSIKPLKILFVLFFHYGDGGAMKGK